MGLEIEKNRLTTSRHIFNPPTTVHRRQTPRFATALITKRAIRIRRYKSKWSAISLADHSRNCHAHKPSSHLPNAIGVPGRNCVESFRLEFSRISTYSDRKPESGTAVGQAYLFYAKRNFICAKFEQMPAYPRRS